MNDTNSSSSPTLCQGNALQNASTPDYDLDAKKLIPLTSATRVLDFLYTKSYINLRIVDDISNDVLYYIDNSSFTPGKADVTLRRGDSKDGLVVGVCRWSNMYSKHFAVGVGDPSRDEGSTIWEEVRTDNIIRPVYEWSAGSSENRSTFAWHRINKTDTQKDDEEANRFSKKSLKLVNCADGEILAILSSHRFKSMSRLGKLIIKVDGHQRGWGRDWETMLLLSLSGVVEMSRRRGRNRRGGAGT